MRPFYLFATDGFLIKGIFRGIGDNQTLAEFFRSIRLVLIAPLLSPYDPNEQNPLDTLQGISREHLLGTDLYGRDILSRIIYGSRISLIIGLGSTLLAFAIGSSIGMFIGYFGRWIDSVVMRVTDMMFAIPQVILAMALAAVLGDGLWNLTFLLAVSSVPGYIRMVCGQVLQLRGNDYITAEKISGASTSRIMFEHLLPNSLSPVLVFMTQSIGGVFRTEIALDGFNGGRQAVADYDGRHGIGGLAAVIGNAGL